MAENEIYDSEWKYGASFASRTKDICAFITGFNTGHLLRQRN